MVLHKEWAHLVPPGAAEMLELFQFPQRLQKLAQTDSHAIIQWVQTLAGETTNLVPELFSRCSTLCNLLYWSSKSSLATIPFSMTALLSPKLSEPESTGVIIPPIAMLARKDF